MRIIELNARHRSKYAGLLPVVHAKHAIVAIYKVIPGSYLHISSGRDNCFYIATMQTGETRIRSKAMPPPNTNPMELDHVCVQVSNPFSRLSMVAAVSLQKALYR